MKPLRLEMQAFGPFAGKEEVDFTNLSKNGLFLICGETGSGKTTILDAFTFALYGKGTNELRNKFEDMRCTTAKWGDDTYVRLDIECKGTIYRFESILECKQKNLERKIQVYRKINDQYEPLFQNCKLEDVYGKGTGKNHQAGFTEELIGLTYEQFKQIVILPQGQFERFLVSPSSEKETILSEIFDVKKWGIIADYIYHNAESKNTDLQSKKLDIKSKLEVENVSNLEDLLKSIHDIKKELENLTKQYIERNVEKEKETLKSKRDLLKLFDDLELIEKEYKDLLLQKDQIDALKERNELASKANPLKETIDHLNKLNKQLEDALKEKETLIIKSKTLQDKLEDANKKVVEHELKASSIEEKNKQKILLNSKRDIYENIDSNKKLMETAKEEYVKASQVLEKLSKEKEEAVEKHQSLISHWKQLKEEHDAYNDKYLSGIYGTIAQKLEENKPCPICGSTHHPFVAKVVEGTPTKQQVDQKKEEADQAYIQANKFEKTIPDLSKAESSKNDANIKYENAKRDYLNSQKNLVEGITNLKELETKIKQIDNEVNLYNNELEKLKAILDQANLDIVSNNKAIDINKDNIENLQDETKTVSNQLVEDIEKTNIFKTVEDVEKAILDQHDLINNTQNIERYNTKFSSKQKALNDAKEKIKNTNKPNIEDILKEEKELEEFINNYNRQKGGYEADINKKQALYDSLQVIQQFIDDNAKQIESDFKLAKTIRGDTGIGLQRYVLGVMFNSVINSANMMLSKVHDGRYKLYRSDEKGKGNKKGLELYVIDHNDPEMKGRSVATLSGGEKFLVSLSLSIGLSTVAQSSGIKLEAMFIDEGFGTLSGHSIDDAMNILMDIKKSAGVVGIISHVQILRENIQTKLEISKKKGNSTIVQSIG